MISSGIFGPQAAGLPPSRLWSGNRVAATVRTVPATDDDRAAFRRRLGSALGRARSRLTKYTQAQIAAELSVDRDTVGRWERGEREPKAFELHWLAQLYGVDAGLFLNPPDSITELELRVASLRRAAQEAAAVAEPAQPSGAGTTPRRDTGRRRTPSRSSR